MVRFVLHFDVLVFAIAVNLDRTTLRIPNLPFLRVNPAELVRILRSDEIEEVAVDFSAKLPHLGGVPATHVRRGVPSAEDVVKI